MKATVVIERGNDGYYSCYVEESFDRFALMGYGDTAEEAKADLLLAYDEVKADFLSQGLVAPELEFTWKYDLSSLFSYFSVLNVSELARKCDINPSQLRQYRNGLAKASESTYDKIRTAIHAIGEELAQAVI